MARIGVFGGSFDPVHLGHLIAAEAAADKLLLQHVRFVIACNQPVKGGKHCASVEDRVAMLEAAITHNPRFVIDLREVNRSGASYTIDTLRELKAEFSGHELLLMIGADTAAQFHRWHRADEIPQLAHVVILTRPGFTAAAGGPISQVVEVPRIDIAAERIRAALGRGDSIRYLVPERVAEYIESRGLYRAGDGC